MPAPDPITRAARGNGERQAHRRLGDFEPMHVARYRWAASWCGPGAYVLDAACGVGYGSALMVDLDPSLRIMGIDRSEDAIAYGEETFPRDQVIRVVLDLDDLRLLNWFQVVVALEILEHVDRPIELLKTLARAVDAGGTLCISTPNQDVQAFDPARWPHHRRHYTLDQVIEMIGAVELHPVSVWHTEPGSIETYEGPDGPMLLVAANWEGGWGG